MKRTLILSLIILCAAVTSWAQKAGANDAQLQQSVQQQLAADPAFAGVHAEAHNGKVTITGSVATKNDRYHAEDLVKSVPGVSGVKNHLKVAMGDAPPPSKPNASGSTGTPSQHLIALPSSGGARLVYASLQDSTPAPSQSANNTAAQSQTRAGASPASLRAGASDSTLQSQIEGALRNDPSLSSSQVSVRVSGDTIEISGSVPTGIEKLTAERLARSFAGDRKVDDKLMVAGQPAGAGSSNPVSQR